MKRIDTPLRWRAYLGLARVARARRHVLQAGRAVALTFDDGPDPVTTPAVLDALHDAGVKASFFCVGHRALRHPDLVQRIAAEGHAVGSHSASHRLDGLTAGEVLADYAEGRRVLEDVLQAPAPLFRPPHGHLSGPTALALRRGGYRSWLWSRDPEDYRPGATAATVIESMRAAAPGDVVLLHDALEEAATDAPPRDILVDALPEALDRLRRRGLSLVTLS